MKQVISEAGFPETVGAYVVWENAEDERPMFVGAALRQSLRKHWQANHLYARAGSSALRRSLGTHLGLVDEELRDGEHYFAPEVEAQITAFLATCWIELFPADTIEEAQSTQARLIAELAPELNAVETTR